MIEKILDKKFCYIIYFIPIFLIAGPAIPDILISTISIFFVIYCITNKKIEFLKNKVTYSYLVFWSIIIFSSLISDLKFISLKQSIFHVRHLIFAYFLFLLIKNNHNFFKNFFPILFLTLLVVVIDGYYQYFFDVNTIGYDRPYANQRLSGFFNDEWILGSYLVRMFPILICVYILYTNKNKYFFLLFVPIYSLLIFLTGERTSFFLLLIFITLLLTFLNIKKIHKFLIVGLIIIIPLIVVNINEDMKDRMFYQVVVSLGIMEDVPATENKPRQIKCCKIPKHLFSYGHSKHYEVAIKMFLDKPFFGHGLKSFRYKCQNFQKDIGCSSHPHNTYVQLLAESGILSFLLVFTLFVYFCYMMVKNYLNRINLDKTLYNARICILSAFIINLFPFVPTGSFFTNWLSIIYFFPLGILFHLYNFPFDEKKK